MSEMRYFWPLLFIVNLAVIVAIWWSGSGNLIMHSVVGSHWLALGRLAGLLAMYLILVQLITIGRVPFLEQTYGHDKLNRWHRYVGYGIGVLFIAHPVLINFGYQQVTGNAFVAQFLDFITNFEDVLRAFIALCIFVGVILFTIFFRKKVRYETWYFVHLTIYIAIIFVFGHQTELGDVSQGGSLVYWNILVYGVGGIFIASRWLRPLWKSYYHQFRIEKVVRENDTVTSVYITGKHMERFRFQAGQFINLIFLAKGYWWSSHPFSLSVAPNGQYIRCSIKNSGDFTASVKNLEPGTRVYIDGPLGVFTKRKAISNKLLFIAGGIGITPIRSMIESLAGAGMDAKLLYTARTEQDLVFKRDFETWMPQAQYFTGDSRITQEAIAQAAPDVAQRDVYLCGPPPMMEVMVGYLRALGVPKRQIHFEKFSY